MRTRILSLDGGGTWAILQAMALKNIYGDLNGHAVLAHFDLAVANSGGSIVLGGLIEDMPLSQIIALFGDEACRTSIFKRVSFFKRLLSIIPIFPKYSTAGKLAGLTSAFGAKGGQSLADLPHMHGWPRGPAGNPVKIMIVAFDYDAQRAKFFRSYGVGTGALPDVTSLVDAVHASSDAPIIYFDAPTVSGGYRYWDGAMAGLNNPLMAGLTDLAIDGVAVGDVVALSLGTGTTHLAPPSANAPADLTQRRKKPGRLTNFEIAASCINDDPPDTATFTAHAMIEAAQRAPGSPSRVVRLSASLRPEKTGGVWRRPPGFDPEAFDSLMKLGMDAITPAEVRLLVTLGNAWMADDVKNQPIRMTSDELACAIGDDVFSAGKARWLAF